MTVKYKCVGAPDSEWDDFACLNKEHPNITIKGDQRVKKIVPADDGWIDIDVPDKTISAELAKSLISEAIGIDDVIIKYSEECISK